MAMSNPRKVAKAKKCKYHLIFEILALGDNRQPLSEVLTQLQSELASDKIQNAAIHQLSEVAVRKMKGALSSTFFFI